MIELDSNIRQISRSSAIVSKSGCSRSPSNNQIMKKAKSSGGGVAVKPTGQASAKVPKVDNAKENRIGTIVSVDSIAVEIEDVFNSSNPGPYKITFSNTLKLNIQNLHPMKIEKGLFPKYKSLTSIVPAEFSRANATAQDFQVHDDFYIL